MRGSTARASQDFGHGSRSNGRGAILLGALASLALALILAPAGASAAPPQFWQAQVGNATPGARGVAVAPETAPNRGHVFVSDQSGRRIVEFTAWGELVKIWGWDVVQSGPGDTVSGELEVCVPADGDVCQSGDQGTGGAGQFDSAAGIAVDSEGSIFAAEAGAPRRVQKFSPEGEFLLSFGGGVNQGGGTPENPGNVCTSEHLENGDTCGAGKTGAGPGEFGGTTGSLRTVIGIAPDGKVWVGDKDRIQRFNTGGEYQGEIVPEEEAEPQTTQQLAVGANGFLYVSYEAATNDAKPNIRKLDPSTGKEVCRFAAQNPRGIAVADDGDVYAFEKATAKILRFGAPCALDPPTPAEEEFGEGLNAASIGLAASEACGIEGHDLFFGNQSPSFVRAYGPPPNPAIAGCEQPEVAPAIEAQYAASVGATSATVEAQINPFFWQDATYYVQYARADCPLTPASPCANRVLFPGAPLTSELTSDPVAARAALGGLEPGTAYHFRFFAESGGGPVAGPETTFTTYRSPAGGDPCPNAALRAGPAAALPDCRAYEMVSPVEKNGGDVDAYMYEGFDPSVKFAGLDRARPDGSGLAFTASTSFADPEGAPGLPTYLARRGPGGWHTDSIDPEMQGGSANEEGVDSQFKTFSEDLCQGWLASESGLPLTSGPEAPEEGFRNLYRRENCAAAPAYEWLESSGFPPEPCFVECASPFIHPDLQGVSEDGRCAAFRVNDALPGTGAPKGLPGGVGELSAWQLYVRCEGGGLRLASVLPSGAPFEGNSTAGTESLIRTASLALHTVEHALSADGTHLYWTASGEAAPKLYLRVNADSEQSPTNDCTEGKACTLQVSPGGFENLNVAQFWTASRDGTRAIFSIVASVAGTATGDLYEYVYDPLEGKGKATLIAEDTLGVAGASEDATRVYFASRQVCSGAKENSEEEAAQPGEPNLYLYEPGESCAGGEMDFIGTLAGEDFDLSDSSTGAPPGPLAPQPRDHVARATPDGTHLAFVSAAALIDYDNRDAVSGQPDRQVYLYDAEAQELSCASCNPTEARPSGANLRNSSSAGVTLWTAAWIPGYQHQLYGRRLISDDGEHLYFNALDALALRDVNGAQDVYQWEAPGSGTCRAPQGEDPGSPTYSAQNEGCVDLISSGEGSRDSEFVEASASGDDVFFRTESSLVSADPGSVDIYDARAGGGFPEPEEPVACEGDACQAVPPAPDFSDPASATYLGPGNAAQAPGCGSFGRRAARLTRRATRLRRNARRVSSGAKAKQMRGNGRRLARRAKAQSNRAKRCRAAARRAHR